MRTQISQIAQTAADQTVIPRDSQLLSARVCVICEICVKVLWRIVAPAMMLGASCDASPKALFESLSPKSTGIAFVNSVPDNPDFNVLNYLYYYNGGGVAAGDIDGDGLPDLYFTSNLGPNRLYRNKGNYQFEDITERAGVAAPNGWKTGVTMADVNGDGRLDIYVSAVDYLGMKGHNVLFINNGNGTFTDRTKEFGLDYAGYSTQAVFFDYDCDGDLDMFLLNHSTHAERRVGQRSDSSVPNAESRDRLFRNEGGRFVDVTDAAGITDNDHGVGGFGLGVVATDVNLDGCPDLYVANDFQENDNLYINNCDGTFTESITKATGHTSRFSMGVDAADFNNDGRPDIVVADMLPEREDILKTSASSEDFNLFNLRLRAGYQAQYTRNTLQLNRGAVAAEPNAIPVARFSEISYLAGMYATDWSWAPLFADLDNDGQKDLFITSGIYRRPNDLDYIAYVSNEAVQASLAKGITRENLPLIQRMPQIALPNHAYRNNGNLTFTNMASDWGLAEPGFSNGATYVDLNNSGALDLVVNRINAPAAIYRNKARTLNGNGYLTVSLHGAGGNTSGIGTTVTVKQQGAQQVLEQNLTRGFQSSVDPRLHFGLGRAQRVDSLVVVWPDRRSQVLANVSANQTLQLWQDSAHVTPSRMLVTPSEARGRSRSDTARYTDVAIQLGANVKHNENDFLDYSREPLIPHRLSTEGPALAVGDVNGDGLDDMYVGGGKWQPGTLLVQQKNGTFRASAQPSITADSLSEDVDAAFFDADGDGDLDLYVVSAGNEFTGQEDALLDRLYLNDGHGSFTRSRTALPTFFDNGSCVVPGDFDGDGDVDLLVGGRDVAGKYGLSPRSHLLRNDGNGHFTDVTDELAPTLAEVGMVTSAAWIPRSGTKALDLVVVGEWMSVRVFRQENGHFIDKTAAAGLTNTEGWWNSVTVADLNADGRPDLILGNLGLNSYVKASPNEPARLYVGDFAHSGTLQQILTFYKNGVSYPVVGRDELIKAVPALRSHYPTYASFGASRVEDVFPASELKQATVREARTFASSVAIDRGDGTYRLEPLPQEAQFAPVYASVARDFDGDGHTDLLLGGNLYGVQPVLGRYDASDGVLLHGVGDGRFSSTDTRSVSIEGEVRHMQVLRHAGGGSLIAVARNNATLLLLRPKP